MEMANRESQIAGTRKGPCPPLPLIPVFHHSIVPWTCRDGRQRRSGLCETKPVWARGRKPQGRCAKQSQFAEAPMKANYISGKGLGDKGADAAGAKTKPICESRLLPAASRGQACCASDSDMHKRGIAAGLPSETKPICRGQPAETRDRRAKQSQFRPAENEGKYSWEPGLRGRTRLVGVRKQSQFATPGLFRRCASRHDNAARRAFGLTGGGIARSMAAYATDDRKES